LPLLFAQADRLIWSKLVALINETELNRTGNVRDSCVAAGRSRYMYGATRMRARLRAGLTGEHVRVVVVTIAPFAVYAVARGSCVATHNRGCQRRARPRAG
jgi:hypothetical protein